jgi:hypothetical protein
VSGTAALAFVITPEEVDGAGQGWEWSAEVRVLLEAAPEEDAMTYEVAARIE